MLYKNQIFNAKIPDEMYDFCYVSPDKQVLEPVFVTRFNDATENPRAHWSMQGGRIGAEFDSTKYGTHMFQIWVTLSPNTGEFPNKGHDFCLREFIRTAPLRLHEADFVEIQQKRD